jgi:hypothetical protein
LTEDRTEKTGTETEKTETEKTETEMFGHEFGLSC